MSRKRIIARFGALVGILGIVIAGIACTAPPELLRPASFFYPLEDYNSGTVGSFDSVKWTTESPFASSGTFEGDRSRAEIEVLTFPLDQPEDTGVHFPFVMRLGYHLVANEHDERSLAGAVGILEAGPFERRDYDGIRIWLKNFSPWRPVAVGIIAHSPEESSAENKLYLQTQSVLAQWSWYVFNFEDLRLFDPAALTLMGGEPVPPRAVVEAVFVGVVGSHGEEDGQLWVAESAVYHGLDPRKIPR